MATRQTLSAKQIYALARRAGLSVSTATTATAVALAESSGRSWVTSPNPDGGTNVGIWQLDTPGGEGSGYTVAQLQDPWTNAQVMAKTTSGGEIWAPWETYVTGEYDQFMPTAMVAADSEPAASQASSSGGSWVSDIIQTLELPFTDTEKAASSAASTAAGFVFPSDITGFFDDAEKFLQAGAWVLNPSNVVRLMSGLAGAGLAIAGIVVLVKAAG
jgi:hypothetical protein